MIRIGMCPDPYFETEWSRNANPHLVWMADSIQANGGEIIPLSSNQIQHPALWKKMNLDVIHLHWPAAAFNYNVARKPVQKVLPQTLVINWATMQLKHWQKAVQKQNVPIIWQIHDLLSHHAVGYNFPADQLLHRTLFNCSDGLVLLGQGSVQPVVDFYGEEKPYAIAPLGSYQPLYGESLSVEESKARLGLTNSGKIFAYLGTARPKRNASACVNAFLESASENDILLIAGTNQDLYTPKDLDPRIHVYHGFVPKTLFLEILSACDFVINDGPNYLTSAIIRTVVSYHKPVICYRYGSAIDYANGCAIWIDDQNGGLAAAIREASEINKETWRILSSQAVVNDGNFTWEQNGPACIELYRQVIQVKKESK
jgi:hypothetical protein